LNFKEGTLSNLLLDYAFKVSSVTPTPAASTGFLKKMCVVVKPKDGGVTTGVLTSCTTQTAIALLTNNVEAQQALNAGLSSVYILPMDDLNLATALEGHDTDFFTIAISSDFDDENEDVEAEGTVTITSYANLVSTSGDTLKVGSVTFTAQSGAVTPGDATFRAATSNDATATSLAAQINAHADLDGVVTATALASVVTITAVDPGAAGNDLDLVYTDSSPTTVGLTRTVFAGGTSALNVGTFGGVVGLYAQDADDAADYAAVENRVGFFSNSTNKAKNLIYALGKLLSNATNWKNQQYITMPLNDGIDELGEAEALFDDRVSFVMNDSDYGNRLGLLACGGKAIVAPYIKRNLEIDLQSKALQWISANQPQYTPTNATLLESQLETVIALYVTRGWITEGIVEISLLEDNFVASGEINISEPTALWRVFAEIQQTL